jgi:hypothetical protein
MDLGRILRILVDVPASIPAEREPAACPNKPVPADTPGRDDP